MNNILHKPNVLAITWILTVCALVMTAFAFASAQTTAGISAQMSPGDSGAQVTALQHFLAADDSVYPEGLITGYYGSLTTAAVQRYQCKEGVVCQGDVATTGYGRVGPATLAKIEEQEGTLPGGGTTVTTPSYPSSSSDVWAPVISAPMVATSSTSATIHWNTNEPAHDRVMYGTVWPFLYATAQSSADTTFDMSGDALLSGLTPSTKYYYVLESVDASGNLQWSINHSFVTTQ